MQRVIFCVLGLGITVMTTTIAPYAQAGGDSMKKDSKNSRTSLVKSSESGEAALDGADETLQLLVSFRSEADAERRSEIFHKLGVREVDKIGSTPLFLVEVKKDVAAKKKLSEVQAELTAQPEIRYAEPNVKMHIFDKEKAE